MTNTSNAQPAIYALRSARLGQYLLILARTRIRAIQLAMAEYGGGVEDWRVADVCFALDDTEAVEIGRMDLNGTGGEVLWRR